MARTQFPNINTVSEWLAATIEICDDPKTAYSKEGMAAWSSIFVEILDS